MKHYKKIFSRYNEQTIKTLFEHLRGVISKRNNGRQSIVDVCEHIVLNECSEEEKVWFTWTMHSIIKETGDYFTPLPDKLKPYYSKYFAKKLRDEYFNKFLMPKVNRYPFESHFNNLFEAFVDEKVHGVHRE